MNLNELRDKVHADAVEKGFWDEPLSDSHYLMLVITELSEAVEADRKGKYAKISKFNMDYKRYPALVDEIKRFSCSFEKNIKDSVEDELSDAFILLLSFAGARNLNLNRFCLQHVVTERKTFTENIYAIVKDIMNYKYSPEEQVNYALHQIRRLSEILKINLPWHIEQKMKYNQSRERLHGKKY